MQVSSAQSPNGAFVENEDPSSVRLDHSVWSSTDHSGWIEDSILSNIFHPPAAGPPTSPRTGSQNDQSVSHSSSAQTLNVARTRYGGATPEIDPMQPDNEGVLGASDMNTLNHRVHLRGASTTVTRYSQGLRYILGHHAVNYLWMHYYSAGSSVVIADAYSTYHHDGESFVRYLVDRNMPPRHATYLWTILRPEVLLGTGGPARKYQPGAFSFEDDQDMSFVRSAD